MDFFRNINLKLTAAGVAAVMVVLIICITVLVLNDKAVPGALYILLGALSGPLAIIAARRD